MRAGRGFPQPPANVGALHSGHIDIKQDQIAALTPQQRQTVGAVFRFLAEQPFLMQGHATKGSHLRIIIDNQKTVHKCLNRETGQKT